MKKRVLSFILAGAMLLSWLPLPAAAGEMCENHPTHEGCSYREAAAEQKCAHTHEAGCTVEARSCKHDHDDSCTYVDPDGEEAYCHHTCSVESGCVTVHITCGHTDDGMCHYVPGQEAADCDHSCDLCSPSVPETTVPETSEPEKCVHEAAGECALCDAIAKVEAEIEKLPTKEEMLAKDNAGRNEIYNQLLAVTDLYDALPADDQGRVKNAQKMRELGNAFAALAAPANGTGVVIGDDTFPDAAFQTFVKKYDTDSDGILSQSERDAVQTMNIDTNNTNSNIVGIAYFDKLTSLTIYGAPLTQLDIRALTQLERLDCTYTNLTALDLSGLTKLSYLKCSGNSSLTSLTLDGCTALKTAVCQRNKLQALEVSSNSALTGLYCDSNLLTALNLRSNVSLTHLTCSGNQLTELDLSSNTDLTQLDCSENQLEALELKYNPSLNKLDCSDNLLTVLLFENNKHLGTITCNNNRLTSLYVRNVNQTVLLEGTGNVYEVELDENRQFDLTTLPGDFDIFEPYSWVGANYSYGSKIITFQEGATEASYTYDAGWGDGRVIKCTLRVKHSHSWAKEWSSDASGHWHACAGCEEKDSYAAHTWKAATCTAPKTCSVCGRTEGNALDHDLEHHEAKAPACTEIGWDAYDTCKRENCGYTTYQEIPAPGHSLTAGQCTACGTVAVNADTFPDANFRTFIGDRADMDKDGFLTTAERDAVTVIDVSRKELASLTGIEYFSKLETLHCWGNQLTTLDVSKNTALTELRCYSNDLTALNVSDCAALAYLDCSNNELTELDVSKNTALTELRCYNNKLTALSLEKNAALQKLEIQYNQLTALAISGNVALTYLDCTGNQLEALDVSSNTKLIHFYVGHNSLDTLDIGKLRSLHYLDCSHNQLTQLDVRNNPALEELCCSNNKLTKLEFTENVQPVTLDVRNNKLTSLNLGGNEVLETLDCGGNQYPITLADGMTFDLTTLPGSFDVTKARGWTGGTVVGNILTVPADSMAVTYKYDCGFGEPETFILTVVKDWTPVSGLTPGQVLEIDGTYYCADQNGQIWLEGTKDRIVTAYGSGTSDLADPKGETAHQQYPTSVSVWHLVYDKDKGAYAMNRIDVLDNIMTYKGTSIRMTGNQGIRIFTAVNEAKRAALIDGGLLKGTTLEGYRLVEYGTLFAFGSLGDKLVYDAGRNNRSIAYGNGTDAIFSRQNGDIWFTGMLVNLKEDLCDDELILRPYMVLRNAQNEQIVIHGGTLQRNIGYVAYQNRDYKPTQAAADFIWNIIRAVYGDLVKEDNAE